MTSGAKVVFILFRRPDLTHDQSMAEWSGNQHTSIVRKIPGLKRWIQNHPMGAKDEGSSDGIGELWFESAEAMDKAMKSAEMSANTTYNCFASTSLKLTPITLQVGSLIFG